MKMCDLWTLSLEPLQEFHVIDYLDDFYFNKGSAGGAGWYFKRPWAIENQQTLQNRSLKTLTTLALFKAGCIAAMTFHGLCIDISTEEAMSDTALVYTRSLVCVSWWGAHSLFQSSTAVLFQTVSQLIFSLSRQATWALSKYHVTSHFWASDGEWLGWKKKEKKTGPACGNLLSLCGCHLSRCISGLLYSFCPGKYF